MLIRVTCPGCLTRFNVSEKFAGREGPCPKCKKVIKIPSKDEEVVIHAPETSGPTDSKGRPVLKPIKRSETILSPVQITLIIAVVIGFLVGALALRFSYPDVTKFPEYFLWIGAFGLAIPVAFVAYAFLRDQELEPFRGSALWVRLGICASLYALSWMAFYIAFYAFNNSWENLTWISAVVGMLALGAAVGMLAWDFDYMTGILHYGMYFGCCLLARWLAGVGVLPGSKLPTTDDEATTSALGGGLVTIVETIASLI